ncbi:MAG: YdcF family protein [Moraxellaceae bacterium]|nr:YdcF family protein [Moraxellaceae bacterium]
MMLTQIVHLLLLPPGLQCILAVIAAVLFYRGHFRWATLLALVAVFSLYLLATPMGSTLLAKPLQQRHPAISDLEQLRYADYQAVVVLGSGRASAAPEYGGVDTVSAWSLQRLRYAAKIQRLSSLPLLVSGGSHRPDQVSEAELMAVVLRDDFIVPVRWLETESKTTKENALASAKILSVHGISHIILVTDALHMPRAQRYFSQAGFTVLPAATGYASPASSYSLMAWLTPQHESLATSRRALHEWLGLSLIGNAKPR